MAGKFTLKLWDYSKESTSFAFYTDAVNAGSIATITTLTAALKSAIQNLIIGNIAKEVLVAVEVDNGQNYPADVNAQRERKWLLHMVDSVTAAAVTVTIGTADLSGGHLAANSDQADMSHADWVALKSAIDGNFNNPKTGNSLVLISAEKVGRDL